MNRRIVSLAVAVASLVFSRALRAGDDAAVPADSAVEQAATPVDWPSVVTGTTLHGTLLVPTKPAETKGGTPTVVYLTNLSIPRLGTEGDGPIMRDLLRDGHLVLVLDYAKDPKARSPGLYADLLKLRDDIAGKKKSLLADRNVDANHLFILAEGFRLKRDVPFDKDAKRTLAMDIQYPSRPARPVPALIEFSCDNANRMNTGSLLFCHDTLVDGGQLAGFAVAMADHPVDPPYKGIDDPMPDPAYRAKAAVRTLRAVGQELGCNGNIGVMGFSRGGPMAALVATTTGQKNLEGDEGEHRGVPSDVQAALVHGNYYDYTMLTPDDKMYARYEKAWGKRDEHPQKWAKHGAASRVTKDTPPMFLDTSDAESPQFRAGIQKLDEQLTAAGVEHHYQVDQDGRGHQVSSDPKTLGAIYAFFHQHLDGNAKEKQ